MYLFTVHGYRKQGWKFNSLFTLFLVFAHFPNAMDEKSTFYQLDSFVKEERENHGLRTKLMQTMFTCRALQSYLLGEVTLVRWTPYLYDVPAHMQIWKKTTKSNNKVKYAHTTLGNVL